MTHTTIDSPIGELLLVGEGSTVTAIYTAGQARPDDVVLGERDPEAFAQARSQLTEYFAGKRTSFSFDLNPKGTRFQQSVWAQLREIPFGETATYGEIAQRLGNPNAARAVGLANSKNPISIVVPCHRVIGASGALTGYAGGVQTKAWLLEHERAARSR